MIFTLLSVVVAETWVKTGDVVSIMTDLLEDKLAAGTKSDMALLFKSAIVPAMLLTDKLDDASPATTV